MKGSCKKKGGETSWRILKWMLGFYRCSKLVVIRAGREMISNTCTARLREIGVDDHLMITICKSDQGKCEYILGEVTRCCKLTPMQNIRIRIMTTSSHPSCRGFDNGHNSLSERNNIGLLLSCKLFDPFSQLMQMMDQRCPRRT